MRLNISHIQQQGPRRIFLEPKICCFASFVVLIARKGKAEVFFSFLRKREKLFLLCKKCYYKNRLRDLLLLFYWVFLLSFQCSVLNSADHPTLYYSLKNVLLFVYLNGMVQCRETLLSWNSRF